MAEVLESVRVLELGQVLAEPFAGSICAGLGAQLGEVERAGGGHAARGMGAPLRRGDPPVFQLEVKA